MATKGKKEGQAIVTFGEGRSITVEIESLEHMTPGKIHQVSRLMQKKFRQGLAEHRAASQAKNLRSRKAARTKAEKAVEKLDSEVDKLMTADKPDRDAIKKAKGKLSIAKTNLHNTPIT